MPWDWSVPWDSLRRYLCSGDVFGTVVSQSRKIVFIFTVNSQMYIMGKE